MRRTIYLSLFLLLALAAGTLTLRAQRTVAVLVATHDVRASQQVAAGDVEVRRVHADSVPTDALATTDDAVGSYVAWPLTAGEPVLSRMVRRERSGIALTAAITVPDGYRAVAVPVQPAGAVGGMLSPGDHVDVYATPLAGHGAANAQAGANSGSLDAASPAAAVLGRDLLVLQLRTDQGQPLDGSADQSVHGLNFGAGKLGSVVIAVPADDVPRFASAAASDSIFLALSVG
ncbi:MAG TPA: Flp pilus assembly protein CpaB [Candidatus Angelobacter sp.]|jgi:Flp pilus assembly protein CpaB|nr:Flp pilus assembly protein CpaB [Candidatus Angelobacter sp.]